MSHMLLIWLLILIGPFIAVAPGAVATFLQLEPQHRGHRRPFAYAPTSRGVIAW